MPKSFYINELFIFELTPLNFLSHEEFLYQCYTSINNPIEDTKELSLFLNNEYFKVLEMSQKLSLAPNNEPNIIKTSKEEYLIDPKMSLLVSMFNDDENQEKNNYELFLKNVDLKEYSVEMSFMMFEGLYLQSRVDDLHKLGGYFYLRKKNFRIDSGSTFGFDYLLYENDDEKLNEKEKENEKKKENENEKEQGKGQYKQKKHVHSLYANNIIRDDEGQDKKFKFIEVQKLQRISNNYNKVKFLSFFLVSCL